MFQSTSKLKSALSSERHRRPQQEAEERPKQQKTHGRAVLPNQKTIYVVLVRARRRPRRISSLDAQRFRDSPTSSSAPPISSPAHRPASAAPRELRPRRASHGRGELYKHPLCTTAQNQSIVTQSWTRQWLNCCMRKRKMRWSLSQRIHVRTILHAFLNWICQNRQRKRGRCRKIQPNGQ